MTASPIRPSIVILDGHTTNPGDLSWDAFRELGDLTAYPRTPDDQLVERAASADIVLTNKVNFPRRRLEQLPKLRYIGVLATGYDMVDIAAAKEQGICVTNVPSYSTPSVAQSVFAHLLHLTQDVAGHANSVRRGDWTLANDWCYWNQPLLELDSLVIGIVGLGEIGRATARLAQAFGMRVIGHSPNSRLEGVEAMELEPLLRASDVVSLHCRLTPATQQLINAERLAWMKPTAMLINTSRGELVDSEALAAALRKRTVAAAGLDVLDVEPPPSDHPLLTAPNCYITPHMAWGTLPSRRRLIALAAENLRSYLHRQPQNVVS